jgi:hypothetical protein
VICTVTGGPCIAFGASGLTLDLNGFSITGLGDPLTGCAGSSAAGEIGIDVNGLRDVVIRGLGLVQLFRNHGIRLNNTTGGDAQNALAWLEKAYEEHSGFMPYVNLDPRFQHFRDLLRRMGFTSQKA